ncbi:MBL fold metallo-hydrolase RNA specificity domain-containing protein [Acidimangrovimonas pyrenivorans]|uniref:MBL fold metallo-hydrolase RNA specificity domain-containing protein n=1 Tax=Acidimangrovimonas pyrenivorans TaxID=2030798 RepID=A0ABV7AGH9_9RHOB
MKLSFHGAARGVTGSCHLLEVAGMRILIDCGMFQGSRHTDEENAGDFGFDPAKIDLLLLTHAHLDHCGRIPLLVKRGFTGEIITTAASRDLAKLIMMDSAHIQEEDADHASRRMRRQGKPGIAPLYDETDVLDALDYFGRIAQYDQVIRLGEGVSARFINAGHILGSAAIVIEATEGEESRRIVFSGDLGNRGHRLLSDPAWPPEADFVVTETTYGDRDHRGLEESVEELYDAIRRTLARGGNVVIPTFALERTQEILFYLKEGIRQDLLPVGLAVYLDSPMAISATQIFRRHAEALSEEVGGQLRAGREPFRLPGLHFTRQVSDSMEINHVNRGAVIMAGSGMCTGGRVRHHLKHNLWRPECSVVFVGFAAEGTLARQIIDGAKSVRISGEEVQVEAAIHTINGFSAHADRSELLDWLSHTGKPRLTFLVHGEHEAGMAAIRDTLEERGWPSYRPRLHERVDLLAPPAGEG